MEKTPKKNVFKIYCSRCDSVFNSRKKFEKHLNNHNSKTKETCPLDVVASKLSNLLRRKPPHNLE